MSYVQCLSQIYCSISNKWELQIPSESEIWNLWISKDEMSHNCLSTNFRFFARTVSKKLIFVEVILPDSGYTSTCVVQSQSVKSYSNYCYSKMQNWCKTILSIIKFQQHLTHHFEGIAPESNIQIIQTGATIHDPNSSLTAYRPFFFFLSVLNRN